MSTHPDERPVETTVVNGIRVSEDEFFRLALVQGREPGNALAELVADHRRLQNELARVTAERDAARQALRAVYDDCIDQTTDGRLIWFTELLAEFGVYPALLLPAATGGE